MSSMDIIPSMTMGPVSLHVSGRDLLVPPLEHARHLIDLGLLSALDGAGKVDQLSTRALIRHHLCHLNCLSVVRDHPLCELMAAADVDNGQRIVRQIGQHEQPPLVASIDPDTPPLGEREPWFATFIDLLVKHGADKTVAVAAVDRLADLFAATYVGWWEWAARRDPILARLGLRPDQCGALVALVAGSRRYRHNGKRDSLLAAVRTATELGHPVEPSQAQRRRLAVFTGAVQASQLVTSSREMAPAGK